ncbi:MAG: hypothetical protein WD467_03050 [Candidatus Saccharimonadales bacterium]
MSHLPFMPSSEDGLAEVAESVADWKYPLDLNRALLPRPASTFLLQADSNRYGVRAGDTLVVDRSLMPAKGDLVIAIEESELRLTKFPAVEVWGVVTYIIRGLR